MTDPVVTLANKNGSHWIIDGRLIEVDMQYDRGEKHWLVSDVWMEGDFPASLDDHQREAIEIWWDANIQYDWSED